MTANCDVSDDRLSLYRDGRLTGAAAGALSSHVVGCARCQLRLADAEALRGLLELERAGAAAALPPDFAARVMAALPEAPPRAWSWRELRDRWAAQRDALWLGAFAVAVAATLLVVFLPGLQGGFDSRPEETVENEAHIHRLEVSSPDQHAIVLQSAEGNTVIWVAPGDENGTTEPADEGVAEDGSVSGPPAP